MPQPPTVAVSGPTAVGEAAAHPTDSGGAGSDSRAKGLAPLVAGAVGLHVLVAMLAPVIAQEAYYAEYSEHPALSYLDHPPMVAWGIDLGRLVFGSSSLGLRAGSVLFSCLTIAFGLRLLRDFGATRREQRLWILASVGVPLFAVGTTLAMTESPLVCFWTLAMWALWRARGGALRYWLLAGVGAGCALLSKYTAAFLAPAGIVLLLVDPAMRRQLRRPGPWLAAVVAALCFTPVVVWNAQHDWASFRLQTEARYEDARITANWITQLVLGQVAALTPVVIAAFLAAVAWWFRRWRRDARALFVLAFGLPLPLFMLSQSPWTQVKLNWIVPAYVALGVGALVWIGETGARTRFPRWQRVGKRLLVASAAFFVLTPALRLVPWSWGNTWSGWRTIAARAEHWEDSVDVEDGVEGNVFFFSTDDKDSAQLAHALRSIHSEASDLEPVMAENTVGQRALAFTFWTRPASRKGQAGICVIRQGYGSGDQRTLQRIRDRFASVECVEHVDVVELGITVQRASIWVCRSYSGP